LFEEAGRSQPRTSTQHAALQALPMPESMQLFFDSFSEGRHWNIQELIGPSSLPPTFGRAYPATTRRVVSFYEFRRVSRNHAASWKALAHHGIRRHYAVVSDSQFPTVADDHRSITKPAIPLDGDTSPN